MQYQNEILDANGYVHSIDMVTIDYFLHINYMTFGQKVLDAFQVFSGFTVEKNSSVCNLPSFKYMFYVDMIWFDGITIYLGKYTNYDKMSNTWDKLDSLRIKVNPNKHLGAPALNVLLDLIKSYCSDGELVRYDYAVDIPCSPDGVLVIGSRKEKGLYKGTRYYGQRHKHGYLKIYDKQKEQTLSSPLTRVEYTFSSGLPPSWDNIVVRCGETSLNALSGLSGTLRLYLDMLQEIQALGGEIEPYIERMTYRAYKKIEPFLFAEKRFCPDQNIIDSLINNINDIFIIQHIAQKIKENNMDADGFITDFGTDLPFD